MYGAYGQGGQQQQQYGYNQQPQQSQYGAPQQQQYGYQQQQQSQYTQQAQQSQMQQQPAANVNVVQPEQQPVVESSKPAPIYVDTQHDDMVRFHLFLISTDIQLYQHLKTLLLPLFIILVLCYVFVLSNLPINVLTKYYLVLLNLL